VSLITKSSACHIDQSNFLHTGEEIVQLVGISNDVSLNGSESVLLACLGYNQLTINFSWDLNGQTVGNTSLVTIYEEDVIQFGKVYKLSLLLLCDVGITSAGNYTCTVSNGLTSVNATTQLMVAG